MRRRHAVVNPRSLIDPDEILADSVSVFGGAEFLEGRIEKPIGRGSSFLFLVIAGLGMGYLVFRAFSLQIIRGEEFAAKAEENRFLTRPILPPRGIIYDNDRQPLVENVPTLAMVWERDVFLKAGGGLDALLERLASLLGEEREALFELGFPRDGEVLNAPRTILVAKDVPLARVVEIASREREFPGIQIVEHHRRAYRDPFAFSHLVGFVGKATEEDLAQGRVAHQEEMTGRTGVEAFYETIVRGKGGRKIVEVDSRGRETQFSFLESPQVGGSIQLSVGGLLQRRIYEVLDARVERKTGASVIAIDPRNGKVRALVSYPGFDINRFGYALTRREFDAILRDPLKPLFNRAIAGMFPSGSVIKPFIAAAALEERLIDPAKKIYDSGVLVIPHPYRPGEVSMFRDWRPHGWVDLYDALAVSANVYFYIIGGGFGDQRGLGVERISHYARLFGLGSRTGIDLLGEEEGSFPDATTKAVVDKKDPVWRVGDTYNISIGQGGVQVTPLQIAAATAAIANGGTLYRPQVLEGILDKEGNLFPMSDSPLVRRNFISQEALSHVVKGMRQAVTLGTARMLVDLPAPVAAKTGTAQAGSGLPHAWVTAFGPFENPEIVIVVMVEHAGEGSTVAVPIMKEILEWYFAHGSREKEF